MTSLDKWPETLHNRSPQEQNICYSEKQFGLVTANIIAFWE
jgi:hypothetical protein